MRHFVEYDYRLDELTRPYGLIGWPTSSSVKPGSLDPRGRKGVDVASDDVDCPVEMDMLCSVMQISACTSRDLALVSSLVEGLNKREKRSRRCIVEIGVNVGDKKGNVDVFHPRWPSFTSSLVTSKHDDVAYVGIDIDDKSYMDDAAKGIFTIACDSRNREAVHAFLDSLGIETIDLLLIDGYHSLNVMLNDWMFASRLDDDGVVLIHDTMHPGPWIVSRIIDREMFDVDEPFAAYDEHGFYVVRRKTHGKDERY